MENQKLILDMITSGVNNLYNNYPYIDKLNVFPVPDGDTGTNMNLTATNGYKTIKDATFATLSDMLNTFSRGLVMGARGNSGVIFSQIIKGFTLGIGNSSKVTVAEWKKGFLKAKEIAYKAVMNPIEGTILTVIRETAENSVALLDEMEEADFWKEIINFSNVSLNNTPNLLQALKDVGVVDSGGYGLVKFLEGMANVVINGTIIERLAKLELNSGGNLDFDIEQEFGYCTEAVVLLSDEHKNVLDSSVINEQLVSYSNTSVNIVIDEDILKVHTHALIPGQVLMFLQKFGDFKTIKVENMNIQAERQVNGESNEEVWTESSDVKLIRNLVNDFATIAIVSSENLKNYFQDELGIDLAINCGSKMNPSTTEILEAIEKVDAKNIFILPNNNNVILAAKTAEKEEKLSKIYVIGTKTIQQGMVSALNFDPSISAQRNANALNRAIKTVTSFSVSTAARDSVADGIKIKQGEQMAIVDGKIVATEASMKILFEKNLGKYINSRTEILTIITGDEATPKDISDLRKILDENFDIEYEIIDGQQKIYSFLIGIE